MFVCSSTSTMWLSLLTYFDATVARFNVVCRRFRWIILLDDDSLNIQREYIAYKLRSFSKLNWKTNWNIPSTKFQRQQVRSKIAVTGFLVASHNFGLFPWIKYIEVQIYPFMTFLPWLSAIFSARKHLFSTGIFPWASVHGACIRRHIEIRNLKKFTQSFQVDSCAEQMRSGWHCCFKMA